MKVSTGSSAPGVTGVMSFSRECEFIGRKLQGPTPKRDQ